MVTNIRVRKRVNKKVDSTDINLLVSPESREEYLEWNKHKIIEALRSEAGITKKLASEIADVVERRVLTSNLSIISTSLIRELVDNELFERGLEKTIEKQKVIGLPKFDIDELIFSKSNDNSNVNSNNPEAIGFSIAENVSKQYALQEVFSDEVSTAHRSGLIYLHDLGHITRLYCSSHSVEFIKKYGLTNLDNLDSSSAPARHARTLTTHINTFVSVMQMYYAGALGLSYINIMYAPFLEGMTDKEIKQEAQHLIFQSAQNAFSRGGQSVQCDEQLIIRDSKDNTIKYPSIGQFYGDFEPDRYYTLSMDRESGRIEWKPIVDAVRHIRSGELYDVLIGNGCRGTFTDDHSLFTLDDGIINEVSAAEVNDILVPRTISDCVVLYDVLDCKKYIDDAVVDGDRILYGRNSLNGSKPGDSYEIKKESPINRFVDLDYDLGMLIGTYVGDGCCLDGSGGIAINCLDGDQNNYLRGIITSKFYNVNPVVKEELVVLHGKIIGDLFTGMCGRGTSNKMIPDEIMFGPIEAVHGFIDGYLSTDGYVGHNRIESSTVSKLLCDQLHILYGRIGCRSTKHVKHRDIDSKIPIESVECAANHDLYSNRIGACDAHKVKLVKQHKENKRTKMLCGEVRDRLPYRYNIRSVIKRVFRDKISLKSNRIDCSTIERVSGLVDDALDYIRHNDVKDISRAQQTLKSLYLYENISKGVGQNTTDKHFYLRDIHRLVDIYVSIINTQVDNLNNLRIILDRCLNVLPYQSKSEKSPKDDKFVYDISVGDNENFLLLNGIIAHNSLFLDFNVHTGVPGYLKNIEAIGPGGQYTGRTYGSYADTATKFTRAMLEVWDGGDADGVVFAFPKSDFHVNDETFEDPQQYELFQYACEVASKNGAIYFVFDRDEVTLSACCRLRTTIDDNYMIDHPESMRYTGFQNVTINLPQCAYRAGKGNFDGFLKELEKASQLCVRAHLEKKDFVKKLMHAPGLPLWQVGRNALDGRPYVDLDAATYIIGVIGLNECLQYLLGKELHEGDDVLWRGLKILSHLYFLVKGYGRKYNMKFTIEESPAESASRRLAKMDMKHYPDAIVRGSVENDDIYYTNSIHLRPDADIDLITRITLQSKFHGLIESGAIIHAFIGENMPSPESIGALVHKIYKNTNCAQFVISPEFTICNECKTTSRGLIDKCPHCGMENMDISYIRDKIRLSKWDIENIK